MGAAAVRINNCGFDGCGDHGADWQGAWLDYLPRSVYAIGVLVIFLRLLQFLKYQQHVGLLLIVLGAMTNDVLYFMVIMGVLSTGFGISFAVRHDPLPPRCAQPHRIALSPNLSTHPTLTRAGATPRGDA
tara:strand:+ start:136 stop:525 length:390 start_codon:yes stop_codon:yes gene_type:complete